jgi:transposase-like protein
MVMGRPPILTEELSKKIISFIKAGNYMDTAARAAGVSKAILYVWLKEANNEMKRRERGKHDKSKQVFVDFLDGIKSAQAEAEVRDILVISKASEKYWQAAAWKRERQNPARWGKKDAVTITAKGASDEQRKRALETARARIAKAIGASAEPKRKRLPAKKDEPA